MRRRASGRLGGERGGGERLQPRADWGAAAGGGVRTHGHACTRAHACTHARPAQLQCRGLRGPAGSCARARPDCGTAPRGARAAVSAPGMGSDVRSRALSSRRLTPAVSGSASTGSSILGARFALRPPPPISEVETCFGKRISAFIWFLKWLFASLRAGWEVRRIRWRAQQPWRSLCRWAQSSSIQPGGGDRPLRGALALGHQFPKFSAWSSHPGEDRAWK